MGTTDMKRGPHRVTGDDREIANRVRASGQPWHRLRGRRLRTEAIQAPPPHGVVHNDDERVVDAGAEPAINTKSPRGCSGRGWSADGRTGNRHSLGRLGA